MLATCWHGSATCSYSLKVLGLAGVKTPPSMDGRSIVPLLLTEPGAPPPALALLRAGGPPAAWRTEQLVEYYGLGHVVRYEHLEDTEVALMPGP